ncbi:hypothetical protein [Candidatus Poriferisodalis sp.]|uniref:hypothetical protein n=1 Tax=Candidatus Poriferisodalis sp. TaxID=3101277 RepID=UPI003B014E61
MTDDPPGLAPSATRHLTETEAASETALLSDRELDAIEDELTRAERTLSLLADDDIDPAAVTSWLPES